MSKVYNLSEDDWTWADEDPNEVIRQFLDGLESEDLKDVQKVNMYEGELESKSFIDYLCVDYILERMQEWAYDDVGDFSSDYLDDVTDEMKEELDVLICGWANKHNLSPKFFHVENVKEVSFDIPEDI